MNALTIVIRFEDGQKPEIPLPVSFGDEYLGGKIAAMAAYDCVEAMEIANEALENSYDDRCLAAAEKIGQLVSGEA